MLSFCSMGQIKLDRLNLGVDYGQVKTGLFSLEDQRRFALQGEYVINRVFSVESYYHFDGDGYAPYYRALGYGANGVWGRRFSHTYKDAYVGIRVYPEENYHSTALNLRRKKGYGFYASFGWRASLYNRHEFLIEETYGPVYDQNGDPILYDDGTVYQQLIDVKYDQFGLGLAQWGINFGCGWKQYHNKYLFTDMGVYSNVFRPDNRVHSGYYFADPDADAPIVPEEFWDTWVDAFGRGAKNGRGFEIRTTIGVNLDFRK